MATLQIVETSLRDGNQCLWGALGIDTAKTLTVAPLMERVGYRAIDFTTSTHMGVAVRYKQEDPWERIRAMGEICRNTPLQFLSTGFRFIAWETASPEFMELAFRTLATNGIRRFALADPTNDAVSNVEVAKLVKRAGGEQVIGALVYSISPIHDDAHYAAAARTLAASPDVDALYIKDPGGLLTPKRAQTLIPAILAEIGDKPLELHNHCTIGLAEPACLEAADLGVAAVQCASGGAADGTSNPPITRMIANLKAMGHTVDIDEDAAREVAEYFTALAEAEGLPMGKPMHFDAAYLRHQLPGGMVG
ncbi:MAG: biotin carboxyl carrier protein, partial [Croceibacterium sp.]